MRPGSLQSEIVQRLPFATPEQEGVLGLLRTADVVRRHLSGIVEPLGLTLQQYNVLRILRGQGPKGLPTLEIVERMIEQAPGITRLLDRLEAKGLARRKRCPKDRRQVLCYISGKGLALLADLDPILQSAGSHALGGLKGKDVGQLTRLLDIVRAGHSCQESSNKSQKEKKA